MRRAQSEILDGSEVKPIECPAVDARRVSVLAHSRLKQRAGQGSKSKRVDVTEDVQLAKIGLIPPLTIFPGEPPSSQLHRRLEFREI